MERWDCVVCGGDGFLSETRNDRADTGPPTSECPACKGKGYTMRETKADALAECSR
jgi:DnaJ-class molecular chaperone